jgi:DNA-binding protein HU-beta
MTRSELVADLVRNAGVTPEAARAAIEAMFGGSGHPGLIASALARGERVQVAGFGTFEVRQRKARVGRDPRTRRRIEIPASAAPAFRPGTALRDHVRGDGLRGAGAAV